MLGVRPPMRHISQYVLATLISAGHLQYLPAAAEEPIVIGPISPPTEAKKREYALRARCLIGHFAVSGMVVVLAL